MIRRHAIIDDAELAEIERELDELDALLRQPRRRPARALPAAGGGVIRTGRQLHNGLRPKPAAFAQAVADGLNPIPAAFRAGYRAPNRMTAWRLLRDPKVRAEIDRLTHDHHHQQTGERDDR